MADIIRNFLQDMILYAFNASINKQPGVYYESRSAGKCRYGNGNNSDKRTCHIYTKHIRLNFL